MIKIQNLKHEQKLLTVLDAARCASKFGWKKSGLEPSIPITTKSLEKTEVRKKKTNPSDSARNTGLSPDCITKFQMQ